MRVATGWRGGARCVKATQQQRGGRGGVDEPGNAAFYFILLTKGNQLAANHLRLADVNTDRTKEAS
jgi:hypothetical protein